MTAELRYLARTPRETEAVGARLARALPSPESRPAIAYLTGQLGAGKTTLVQGFLWARGFADPVRSPTYTLLECYQLPALTIVHLDLYRLRDPSELGPLGLRDYAHPHHLWLIEWPEQAGGRLPPPDLTVSLEVGDSSHTLRLTAGSDLGSTWLAATRAQR